MLRRRELLRWFTLILIIACPLSLWGAEREMQAPKTPIARLEVQPARIDWLPQVDYDRLVLTVAGPGELYLQREFGPGETPSFSTLDGQGDRLSDGVYAYELRAVPRPDPTLGNGPAAELQKENGLSEQPLVQSGHLWVQGGSFVERVPVLPSPSGQGNPELKLPPPNFTPKDIVHPDDLVVQGHACIGSACTAVVPGDPTLKFREDFGGLFQIKFEPIFCCHPTANHWTLEANNPSEVSGDFLIRTFDTIAFRIGQSAPVNALTISSGNGNIGLGTLTPGAKLHLFANATEDVFGSAGPNPLSGPAFNFGYGGASFGRGAAFLNARPDASAVAPNPSLRFLTANVQRMIITNAGNVGIGTTNPAAKLEVSGGEVRFPAGVGGLGFTHFVWPGDGKNYIRGTTIIADNGGSVGIGTTAPSSRLHVNGGDIRVSGGSFIDDGVTLNAPDYVFEPTYKLMPLEELRKFVTQEKHLPNVPNAREVKEKGLNLSQFQMRLLEKVEELTLYTLSQQEQIGTLHKQNSELRDRLEVLEEALQQP